MSKRRKKKNKGAVKIIALIIVVICAAAGINNKEDLISLFQTARESISEDVSEDTSESTSEEVSEDTASDTSEMTGDFYSIVGEAEADTSVEVGEIIYSDLDSLGRAGKASGCITYDMVITAANTERESMSDLYPSGWTTNQEVTITFDDGTTYHGYFWNRSHLIAHSLGGNSEIENIITGTRAQNVGKNDQDGGMGYCETLVRNWIYDNKDGYVYYSAEPIYDGDDLVAKTVEVNMLSSDGSIDQKVIIYNEAPGYTIDYATGEYYED